jgi:transposase-like protein
MAARNLCPYCAVKAESTAATIRCIQRGWYRRKFDGRRIQRFLCKSCKKTFSTLTGSLTWRQQKPFINNALVFKLCSGVSQRRAARELGVDPKTVARRLVYLANVARQVNHRHLMTRQGQVNDVRFDDMESSIHTKLKPVSIPIVVEHNTREIIALKVCSMPAKGHLAKKSLKRYGPRKDDRPTARRQVLDILAKVAAPKIIVKTDQCPQYAALIKAALPQAQHATVKGRRGCVVGQGELKKIGFDPLFSLNHTAASIRANVNRLFRRTWCTSKRDDRLQDHLDLYVWFHNHYLLANPAKRKPPSRMPTLRLRL